LQALSPVDVVALAILALAVLRGLWIGLIREVFSLVGLAAAVIAVRLGSAPVAEWLRASLPVELGSLSARIAAGAIVAVAVILAAALAGRIVRRGARWAGLGFADRLAGGGLGAAEGALAIVLLMLLATAVLGRDHPTLAGSRTLAAFESAESLARRERPELPAVKPPAQRPAS
jgi:membrane protein required for colicin V production